MEQQSPAGYAALLHLNEKISTLIATVNQYKDNKKALKICVKLIKADKDYLSRSSLSVSPSAEREILWRYDELSAAVKKLTSGNLNDVKKAADDLDALDARTKQEIDNILSAQAPVKTNAQKITEAVNGVAQKLKNTVSEKMGQLKKKFVESALSSDNNDEQ